MRRAKPESPEQLNLFAAAPPKGDPAPEAVLTGDLKVGDPVIDNDGFHGTIVEYHDASATHRHVFVKVAKNHPLAWLDHPIMYAMDRLRKVNDGK